VTTQQKTTDAQGQAAFPDAGVTIQANDIMTQQGLPNMLVTLCTQQNGPLAVSVVDPTGEYAPGLHTLGDPPATSASGSKADPTYAVNTFASQLNPVNGALLPVGLNYQWQYESTCNLYPGSQVPSLVDGFLAALAPGSARSVVYGPSLGEAADYAGDVETVSMATNEVTALAYAEYIARNDPNELYYVCENSTPTLLGLELISIKHTGLHAPTGSTTVVGTVGDNNGNPVYAASVTAIGPGQQTVQTDTNGNFTISNLAPGPYTFQASKVGYAPSETPTVMAPATNNVARLTLGQAAIYNVGFSATAGGYTATVNGAGLGTFLGTLPFTGDSSYLRIGDAAQPGHGEYGYSGDANLLTYHLLRDNVLGWRQYVGSRL
jgi:hypothetical protein